MTKTSVEELQIEQDYLIQHARMYRTQNEPYMRKLIEGIFLLTIGKDFVLNVKPDGKVDLEEM